MKNKTVGYIVLGFALVVGIIIYIFNRALTKIVNVSCTHGISCPMWETLNTYTAIAIIIMVFIIIVGLYLIFKKEEKEIVIKTKKIKVESKPEGSHKFAKKVSEIQKNLNQEESSVLQKVINSQGSIYQSELVSKTNLSKVKVTRILDKLEGLNLIERKRRGMTNIIIIKH